MRNSKVQKLAMAAVIAAVYAVLTVTLPIPQFGTIQCRLAEALTVLPFFFPGATPGLVVGCFIANLFSPYPLDILCGTLATLLACLLTQRMPRWLAPLPPCYATLLLWGQKWLGLRPVLPVPFPLPMRSTHLPWAWGS